jgi:anti-sigma28 factor (negative regulator of flagellin synthesis)
MSGDKPVPKSLIEQIYDELAKRLDGKEGFDADLVERIKELAKNGELKSHAKIQTVLKP